MPHAAAAATNCQITVSNFSYRVSFAWHTYSGVGTVGTPQINNTASSGSTMSSPTMTATHVGSFIVGMLFNITGNVQPITPAAGSTMRRNSGGNAGESASTWIGDAIATSIGQQITVGAVANVSATYRSAAVELVPTPTNREAKTSDVMHTVLMNTPRNMDYELPANGLSPTWCTWFMPIGSHVYALEPQTPRQLNSQSNEMHIPSWQMTRICQDESGNYWASPPLLAGSGISITPAATGLTISATGTPGSSGMTYIGGGVATIPGTVALQPDTCATLHTTNVTGLVDTDVVSFSLQNAATTWNHGKTFFHAISNNGQIAWRGCNTATTAYTPSQRNVNWYVLRHTVSGTAARHKPVRAKK